MASSISAQLQAIKSLVQADLEPLKRPFTRPSILFTPKEAADIDIDTILGIALSGLEALVSTDERFRNYRNDLFSHKSRELDRELMGREENDRINASISSYLRLLSGYLQFPASLKTIEYLIRRYKIHVYNMEDLILCALPFHDTRAFVQIVQLLNTGNSKWKFLDSVKTSGAPPPRSVIVQQCVRDMGVLEVLCEYASRTKKYQPSTVVIGFCTAVIVEVLGTITTVDSDIVKRILPFVDSGLQPGMKGGSDQQAGALMIVGMLANRSTLNPNLVKRFIRSIVEIAHECSREASDPRWLRLSFMALVNFVQLQHVDLIPKKALDVMKEIRDIAGVLMGLSKEFNIDRFLMVLLDSFVYHSSTDDLCLHSLTSIIGTVPISNLVEHLVSRVLSLCMTSYQKNSDSVSSASGGWAKKILVAINKNYPAELRKAVRKFLEDTKVHSKKEDATLEMLCNMLDGDLDMSLPFSDSRIWFRLHHPKAAVRRATLSGLNASEILKSDAAGAQSLVTIQDAILRQLWDDDLAVVLAALSLNRLSEIVNGSDLLEALCHAVKRCIGILILGSSGDVDLAVDVVASFLKIAASSFHGQADYSKKVATMMFPFLLLQPKTRKLSLRILELVKEVNWPFFDNLVTLSGEEMKKVQQFLLGSASPISMEVVSSLGDALSLQSDEHRLELIESICNFNLSGLVETLSDFQLVEHERKKLQKELLKRESISSFNMLIVCNLAERFVVHPGDYLPWLIESCVDFNLSKTLFFLVLMQSFQMVKNDSSQFLALFEVSFPVLKTEWEVLEVTVDVSLKELSKSNCRELLFQLFDSDINTLNAKTLICLFWGILETFVSLTPPDMSSVNSGKLVGGLQDLFVFFSSSRSSHVFKEHLRFLIRESKVSPVRFLSRFFTAEDVPILVQKESLSCFTYLCSEEENKWLLELLSEFPSLLVPLSSDSQDLRIGAMNCIEGLCTLWHRADFSSKKNGNTAVWSNFLDEILGLIAQQRRLILSDKKFFPSFLTSLLSSSQNGLLVPQNLQERFDQPTKEKILAFILGSAIRLPAYGKLRVLSLLKGLGSTIMHFKDVESLLSQLLKRRSQCYFEMDKSCQKLSGVEVKILCLLLECSMMRSPTFEGHSLDGHLLKALQIDCMSQEDPAIISPCLAVLEKLSNQFYNGLKTEMQDSLFHELATLLRSTNGNIQNATREALLRLNISCPTIVRELNPIIQQENLIIGSFDRKKKKKKKSAVHLDDDLKHDMAHRGEKALVFLCSLLDIVLLKKDLRERDSLVGPLFKLLERSMSSDWVRGAPLTDESVLQDSSHVPQTVSNTICSIQQTLLLILKDIFDSHIDTTSLKAEMVNEINVKMLVEFARFSTDGVTRNHVFSLFSSIAKMVPEKILDHIIEILTLVGESTVIQIDSHSRHVFEDFIATVVPFWLSKTNSVDKLLLIFVKVLPEVGEHRRLSMVVHLLRTLGEQISLATLLILLFRSLVSRKGLAWLEESHTSESYASSVQREWEYAFAVQICGQYSSSIWLPSLVRLLQLTKTDNPSQEFSLELRLVIEFISHKMQDPEFAFKLESRDDDSVFMQGKLEELMEGVISLLPGIDTSLKQKGVPSGVMKELKMRTHAVLRTITAAMSPSAFFEGITTLLHQSDNNMRKKALGLLSETAKDTDQVKAKQKGRKFLNANRRNPWLNLDETALESFRKMCEEVIHLIDNTTDESSIPSKLAAVSTLEVLASRFPSGHPVFTTCLTSVSKGISSDNLALSSSCLRTTGALIGVLGPKALAEIPHLMKNLITKARDVSSVSGSDASVASEEESLMLSVLVALKAVVNELGGFLNPYLEDIIELMVLHPKFVSESDQKLKTIADAVRRLLTEKIPVRLALQPLLKMFDKAVNSGDSSLVITFEMLASLVVKMDKSSVSGYHGKIFDRCLHALDLRRQKPNSVQDIDTAERSVISAMIALTMKLTESMFKPLFIRSIEWADSEVEDKTGGESKSIDRAISFYGLVNKLSESHRSLFVPYFKYLLDGAVSHLSDAGDAKTSTLIQKKKKRAKLEEANGSIQLKTWHLRTLVLSSFHRCFLYDTGNLKFLDSNNFQVLLKPIVSQLVVEPPASLEEHPHIPSVQEVDDLLVSCIGQMAVTAGSDLLWKPLNHEVLMQTRSEKIRARILGLRIIKQLLENLKEEYLVLLAETVPFLGELLEDVELSVKSLAQDVLKQMEELSGESLREYL